MKKVVLSVREGKLLEVLSRNEEISADDLSTILSVSSRTLRNDVKNINDLFDDEVIASSHNGYSLQIKSILNQVTIESFDRNNVLIRSLLEEEHPVDIDEFAERHYISKTTLLNSLKSINLNVYSLKIERDSNHIFIAGSEYSKRRLIKKLLFSEIEPLNADLNSLSEYFDSFDIEKMEKIVLSTVDKYNLIVEKSYMLNLMLNIIVAFDRIFGGFHAEETPKMNEDFLEYQIGKEICEKVAESYNVEITDDDVNAIANIFIGQMKHKLLHQITGVLETRDIDESFKSKIRAMVNIAFNHYMINVNTDSFIESFITHCDQLVHRARQNNLVSNTLEKNIKYNFPFIYDVAVYLGNLLEYEFDIKLNESEIAYIAIHIGFAIENNERETDKVNIVVLSNDYMNIRSNIMHKISEQFSNINIVNVVTSVSGLAGVDNFDLLISTEYVQLLTENAVYISYLYTEDDRKKVENAINDIAKKKRNSKLKKDLLACFQESLFFIDPDVELNGPDDVIEFLGRKVIEFGIEEEGYIESIKERESLSSTLFAESFAIPHPMKMTAKKTMFTILLSRKGIKWDDTIVHAVFLGAIKQGSSKDFMELYNNFTKILIDDYKLAKLISSDDFEKFFWRLSKMLEEI